MCGIAGFFNSNVASEEHTQLIQNMLRLIVHRGPDEVGYYSDHYLSFGTVRLSIIDIEAGKQPLGEITNRYWICYNGEIYNYRELSNQLRQQGFSLRTDSDTEVVLYAWIAWGSQAFERLNGAFAFAIYDRLEKTLILARDRYGKRPLYYYQHPNQRELLFASELKCFLAYPSVQFSLDEEKLASAFCLWTSLGHETVFQNFRQLPEGCYLLATEGNISIHSYAKLNFAMPLFTGTEDEAAIKVRSLLKDSVRLRLRSDVDVGLYLSGGLDSAIIAKLAVEQTDQSIHSFSIAFEEKEYDESAKQQLLSQYLGTRHTTLTISNAEIANVFPLAIWHAEMPQFRTALVPMYLLAKQVRSRGIKVVLTGEGADEAFLGYDIFKETILRKYLQENPHNPAIRDILLHLYPYLAHYQEKNYKALLGVYNNHYQGKTSALFSHTLRYHNSKFALRLLKTERDPLSGITQLLQNNHEEYSLLTPIEQAQWLEFKTLLSGYLLSSQGDRMSLAHGVEGRCPFLDFNIVDFAATLPQDFKLKGGYAEKNILKQAFQGELPPSILQQPKQPYRAPDALAFLKSPPDYLELLLSDQMLRKIDVLNVPFCQQLIAKLRNDDPQNISPRENQAFIQLLSLTLLKNYFVDRNYPSQTVASPRVVRVGQNNSAAQL